MLLSNNRFTIGARRDSELSELCFIVRITFSRSSFLKSTFRSQKQIQKATSKDFQIYNVVLWRTKSKCPFILTSRRTHTLWWQLSFLRKTHVAIHSLHWKWMWMQRTKVRWISESSLGSRFKYLSYITTVSSQPTWLCFGDAENRGEDSSHCKWLFEEDEFRREVRTRDWIWLLPIRYFKS